MPPTYLLVHAKRGNSNLPYSESDAYFDSGCISPGVIQSRNALSRKKCSIEVEALCCLLLRIFISTLRPGSPEISVHISDVRSTCMMQYICRCNCPTRYLGSVYDLCVLKSSKACHMRRSQQRWKKIGASENRGASHFHVAGYGRRQSRTVNMLFFWSLRSIASLVLWTLPSYW